MSENQKCLNLIQQFSKISEIQKSLKFPMGGGRGSSLFGNFSQIFMMATLRQNFKNQKSKITVLLHFPSAMS